MTQPSRQLRRTLRAARVTDLDRLLNGLRTLDRTVVEISMNAYKVPRRDRAAMREQHRRLHDMIRERLPRLLGQHDRDI